MAAITITSANVRPANERSTAKTFTASQAITAGQAVHLDTSTNKIQPGDAGSATAPNIVGIAMSDAAADGDLVYVQDSLLYEVGGTVTQGQFYYLSPVAGGIAPFADLGSGDWVVQLMQAQDASTALIDINNTGIDRP